MKTPICNFQKLTVKNAITTYWLAGSRGIVHQCLQYRRYALMAITRSYGYIDTSPKGDALRSAFLTGPYTPTMVTTPAVPGNEDSLR
ncbi:hypothetical protein Tco_0615329 [Tanacetum coccineum]